MKRMLAPLGGAALLLAVAAGCSSGPKVAHMSGKVMFNNKPVPAGFISFMPDVTGGNQGSIRVAQIKDGVYDTSKEPTPGVFPGQNIVRIAGFDGKPEPGFPTGKQIFNPIELNESVPEGTTTKDFTVPLAAAQNLRIEPTADP